MSSTSSNALSSSCMPLVTILLASSAVAAGYVSERARIVSGIGTAFTRTPSRASCLATVRTMPRTAALDTQYAPCWLCRGCSPGGEGP
ncbi:hypothetical protein E2562_037819 [Oryza meyeriana var. granulata]|uniref:Secreted protein n=1 Tax=Oryza meyeriana var. granulata TaxID=110450 RepID=A0A6G1C280_9ORYZ|nr:hypothetical protein E2562_037819 [Oryza meyeriana var. granulata]